MYILIGILSFFLLILLHEFGHFILAKKFKVKVYEFGIGLPPKIATLFKDKDGTEYTLNAIPLGGFIRPKGENLHNKKEITDPDSFHSKALWQKILILSGGVIMNLIIAFVLFTVAFWHGIKPIFIIPDSTTNFTAQSYLFPTVSFAQKVGYIKAQNKPVKVEGIIKTGKTLSSQINFQTGDIIEKINNIKVNSSNISAILKKFLGHKVVITIKRQNQQLNLTGNCPSDGCLLGIYFNGNTTIHPLKMNLFEAMKASWWEIKNETILTFEGLKLIINKIKQGHTKQAVETMSGPVGAIAVGKYILQIGIWEYIAFVASISLALAIFNILPIPALDGGRILTTIILHLGRFKPQKYLIVENYINIAFFLLLMLFGFYIMYLDFIRFY